MDTIMVPINAYQIATLPLLEKVCVPRLSTSSVHKSESVTLVNVIPCDMCGPLILCGNIHLYFLPPSCPHLNFIILSIMS